MSFDAPPSGEPVTRRSTVSKPWVLSRWFLGRDKDPKANDANAIGDMRFMGQLALLTSVKNFLVTEAVKVRDEDAPLFSFGSLNQLRYFEKGRLPTVEEWELLDKRALKLFSYLDDGLRKRFQLIQTANLIAGVPVLFIILALISLSVATFLVDRSQLLVTYFFWTICLGALGSIAFLSMNALSIQNDMTFDLTNKSLLWVRIVLGSLFGLVLSIPFGFEGFVSFCGSIAKNTDIGGTNSVPAFGLQGALLLLPFILGFSASLVMLVLNRFVESIAVFFGDRRR
jgi:hypothetical protein